MLGAGGIGSGRQVAASLALGAQGVWTGSHLASAEYDLGTASAGTATQEALLAATSADTVRTRIYTGKPARLLKTRVDRGLGRRGRARPLPMPLQNLLVTEAHNRINASDDPTSSRCRSARSSAG